MNKPKCYIEINEDDIITLAHGGGGSRSEKLIREHILPYISNPELDKLGDGALINLSEGRYGFSTDSFVVDPLFFPGGDIGELAVYGTVNDLACCGAVPMYLSLSFILEEGFFLKDLDKIMQSISRAAKSANIKIITGDTKVVPRGKGDKIFINTSGIGIINTNANLSYNRISAGDRIIINGEIASHGIAVMTAREGIMQNSGITSDTQPLNGLIQSILNCSDDIKFLRDPTRGGLASSLNEIAKSAELGISINEEAVPIAENVKSACELFGFDPMYVANEGKVLIFVSETDSNKVLNIMKQHPMGEKSAIIGEVTQSNKGRVLIKTAYGTSRVLDMLSGEQLPRIC